MSQGDDKARRAIIVLRDLRTSARRRSPPEKWESRFLLAWHSEGAVCVRMMMVSIVNR